MHLTGSVSNYMVSFVPRHKKTALSYNSRRRGQMHYRVHLILLKCVGDPYRGGVEDCL